MLESLFQTASEFELLTNGALDMFFLECSTSSLARNHTISGAILVSVTMYTP